MPRRWAGLRSKLEHFYGRRFFPVPFEESDEIAIFMETDLGPGGRVIVSGSRLKGNVGHVFNVIATGRGKARSRYGQIGVTADGTGYQHFYLLPTLPRLPLGLEWFELSWEG
jgi:hypothetical protein